MRQPRTPREVLGDKGCSQQEGRGSSAWSENPGFSASEEPQGELGGEPLPSGP